MRYRNTTNRFGFNGSQLSMKKSNKTKCFPGKNFVNTTALFYMIAVILTIFLFAESVNAQSGYVVQPGRIDIEVRPRQIHNGELKIHNFDPNNNIQIDLKVIELTQKGTGEWLPFDTDPCSLFDYYPDLDLSNLASCSSWVKLDKDSVTISPDDDAVIDLKIATPYRAKRGIYGATIMASTRVKESESELTPLVIRTGVPVVVNVGNSNRAPKVQIQDIGMEFVPSEDTNPGKVLLNMKVNNTGETFPLLSPVIRIRGFIDGHWKLITTHKFDEIGIIPGVELDLKSDIGRSLPSAKYRLDAALYVNQSLRGAGTRFGKEVDFEGDPMITTAPSDVPLDLEPREITISMKPGLRRPADIKIHAAVEERIEVQAILDVPQSFKGKVDNNIKVEDSLTCLDWLTFQPQKLSLEDFLTRNMSIYAEMPEDALQYPNYYAALGLKVVYPDGQVAGTTWVNICIENGNLTPEPKIICSAINFEEMNADKSEYIVQAGYTNTGNTHIVPTRVRAAVVKAEGYGYTSALLSTDKTGMFMPYDTRNYTGVLDFSTLNADQYNLEVLMDYPTEQQLKRQIRIRVRDVRGKKIPEIVNKNIKSDELIQVKWY